ncbi:hypothetical protein COV11_03590 [Candidatus Woesearchaeota archaeon CG10_big_fil_rev_8_21_14_0_10_30_7]|nr:MAG: hypothetical protein COV11_03590 [Candidatus Woesearchaeota archaeon CG10_big_fil_rev_8_21_14_0_10_30_7]
MCAVFDPEIKERKKVWPKILLIIFMLIILSINGFLIYEKFNVTTGQVIEEKIVEKVEMKTDSELNAKIVSLENKLSDFKNTYKNELLGVLNSCSIEQTSENTETSCDDICYNIGPRKTCVSANLNGNPSECRNKNEGKLLCTCCKTE